MQSKTFLKAKEKIRPETRAFVSKNLAFVEQIYHILDEKKWTQKTLAQKLNKSESEISKWMGGLHNFTFKTVSKLETILGQEILVTPKSLAGRFNASIEAHARKIESDAVACFSADSSTIIYTGRISLKTDGRKALVQDEARMIFTTQATYVELKEQETTKTQQHEPSAA
jgi:transcriptional regulator with XRE-family HTH domain